MQIYLFYPEELYQYIGSKGIVSLQLLAYCSSCCNPITYCFMNRKFRQAFISLIKGCKLFRYVKSVKLLLSSCYCDCILFKRLIISYKFLNNSRIQVLLWGNPYYQGGPRLVCRIKKINFIPFFFYRFLTTVGMTCYNFVDILLYSV